MPKGESYGKKRVESVLCDKGFSILQERDGFTLYQTHMYPGGDLVIDWSKGKCGWEDLKKQLDDLDIDAEPIHALLIKS